MAKSLQVIQRRIARLQAEADAIKAKEVAGVIDRIRAAIAHYGLTVEQVFGTKRSKAGSVSSAQASGAAAKKVLRRAAPAAAVKAPIKYRDSNGNTWSGRGSQPRWLRGAIEGGKRIEDFAVKS